MNLIRYILLSLLVLTSAISIDAKNLILKGEYSATIGVYIKDLSTGQILADTNSELALTPASTTKAVTTATALSLLGTDFRFVTETGLSGSRSSNNNRKWIGNLIINSSADPTLENEDFEEYLGFADSIVAKISRLGITEITGKVIINENLKDPGPIPYWECDDIAWPYGAGIFGFNYAGNWVKAYPVKGITVPESNLKITCRTARRSTNLRRGIDSNNLIVWGTRRNLRKASWSVNTTLSDPADMFRRLITSKLKESGIKIGGLSIDKTDLSTQVYTHLSPTSAEICTSMMKRSDNLFAEGMLRAIAPDSTREACLEIEYAFLDSIGVNTESLLIRDGSGLSRSNYISPIFMSNLLETMAKSPVAPEYVATFPIAGVDGTLKKFLKETPLEGMIALKTGTVRSVATFAGYKLDENGNPTHSVVVFVNGFTGKRADVRKHIADFLLGIFEN